VAAVQDIIPAQEVLASVVVARTQVQQVRLPTAQLTQAAAVEIILQLTLAVKVVVESVSSEYQHSTIQVHKVELQ
jgi:hypothetical protein